MTITFPLKKFIFASLFAAAAFAPVRAVDHFATQRPPAILNAAMFNYYGGPLGHKATNRYYEGGLINAMQPYLEIDYPGWYTRALKRDPAVWEQWNKTFANLTISQRDAIYFHAGDAIVEWMQKPWLTLPPDELFDGRP